MVSALSSGDIVKFAESLWTNHFEESHNKSGGIGDVEPVCISLNLETPLGLAAFLANNAHLRKVFVPSTFNMTTILKGI